MARASVTTTEPTEASAAGGAETGALKAAPGSPLFNLRATREDARAKLFVDLPVPRWAENGTRLFVRFGPLSQGRMEQLTRATERSKDPERNVRLNARMLADACLGVFVVVGEDDGEPIRVGANPAAEDASDPTQWPRFDDDLAASLGVAAGLPAAEIVRELFFTDGDVVSTANRLANWSGYVLSNDDLQDQLGN